MATARVEPPLQARPATAEGRFRSAPEQHGWWLAPAAVVAVLGGWLVARRHGLWYDELYTAEVARLPLADLARALVTGEGTIPYLRDAPPSYNAPYYATAHLWLALTRLQPDEVGLRLLSLVAAVAAVAVFTRAVARLSGDDRAVATVAGLVVATNPFVVQFAGEARGYAFALLATAAAALGFARWLDGESRALLLYGGAAAAAGLAHWFALLVPAAFAVAGTVLYGRRAVRLVLVTAAAAVPALGLAGIALANGVGDSGAEWIAGVHAAAVPHLLLRAWSGRSVVLAGATVAAATAGLLAVRRSRRQVRLAAGVWFGLPLVAVTAAEALRPVFVDRYLLPAVLGLAVLVAVGLRVPGRRFFPMVVTAVLAVSVAATVADVRVGPKDDVRGAMAAVAEQHRPGEPVVAAARWDALGVDHYGRRHPQLVPDLVLPPAVVPEATSIWVVRRARGGVKGDVSKLEALDRELAGRQMRMADQYRFEGRYADVVVQRWRSALNR